MIKANQLNGKMSMKVHDKFVFDVLKDDLENTK